MWGSSPLTRGKRRARPTYRRLSRLIPAHAGKTALDMYEDTRVGAHPRSRGENGGRVAGLRGLRGSSPLTRGKRWPRGWPAWPARLIPAHAGKTHGDMGMVPRDKAHPRSRGENWPDGSSPTCCPGSSPLTRGKRNRPRRRRKRKRLIPAHAGKTQARQHAYRAQPAHPRSRGENLLLAVGVALHLGSSPLTRGKLRGRRAGRLQWRLIPAHAGKTPTPRSRESPPAAHPRSRGENYGVTCFTHQVAGSSPLTRGKRGLLVGDRERLGLIPAHAGKTSS